MDNPQTVLVVMLCDESGRKACCQEVAVVTDFEAFEAYAKANYANPRGNPVRGYELYDKNGDDLNFTLVTMRYELLTAERVVARQENSNGH